MSGWLPAILGIVLVLNPPGVSRAAAWADRSDAFWRREAALVVLGAGVALAGLGLLTAPLLDLADLSVPTFRLAASVVIGVTAVKWLLAPVAPIHALTENESTPTVLGLTLLLTPGPVMAAMTANADGGTAAGLVGVAIAAATALVALVTPRLPDRTAAWLTRLVAAAAVVVAVGIGIDSARTV